MESILTHNFMKKLNLFFVFVFFLFGVSAGSADDHPQDLEQIGERIKKAVKAGKLSEKEGWAKWHAALRKLDQDDEGDEWGEIAELEQQIEIRALEFELERMEHQHEMERLEWEQQIERMKHDFDRERREWSMDQKQWEMRRKQMDIQLRARPHGMPPHLNVHPKGHHGHGDAPRVDGGRPGSKKESSYGKKDGKSCCGKCKSGCEKKESCKKDECKKAGDSPSKDSSCKKGKKSCPDKKDDCHKKNQKK
jgi:hypothetical protein